MISVLLPTIRPTHIVAALDSLRAAGAGVVYEIVVVADFPAASVLECRDPWTHLHIHWIEAPRQGVIPAIATAEQAATGDYLFVFNDESQLVAGGLKRLLDEAERKPGGIVTPRHVPTFPFRYYGKPFAPFPFVHRYVVAKLGGLFDPIYHAFYADPDFCLRAHAAGVPIHTVEDVVLTHTNRHDAAHMASVDKYLAADRALFRSRWDHLGAFADP